MRAVVQRVRKAAVHIKGTEHSRIGPGLLVLIGIEKGDTAQDAKFLAKKITHLRMFEDHSGRMNLSLLDTGGSLLAVSQFTLLGDTRKGHRPSFDKAAASDDAHALYDSFVEYVKVTGLTVKTGVFQAMMDIESTNYGPVTLVLDNRRNL